MWKLQKMNRRRAGSAGFSESNSNDSFQPGLAEVDWPPSISSRIPASVKLRTLGRRASLLSPIYSSASRRALIRSRRRLSPISSSDTDGARNALELENPDWNLVAEEIETVVFGDSDDDDDDDDDDENIQGFFRRRKKRSTFRNCRRSNRSIVGILHGRKRKYPPFGSWVSIPSLAAQSHLMCNLFDEHQMPQRAAAAAAGRSTQPSQIVINAHKHCHTSGSVFGRISVLLSGIFVALLVIRIVTNILTARVGMGLVCLLAVRMAIEFTTRPIQILRALHASPVFLWACFGGTLCAVHAIWHYQQHRPLLPGSENKGNKSNADGIFEDLVMFWGLIRGLIFGAEIGSLWLIVFGDVSNPSRLTQNVHRLIWRPVRRYYKRRRIERQTRQILASSGNGSLTATTMTVRSSSVESKFGNDVHRCVICLESFHSMRDEPSMDEYTHHQNILQTRITHEHRFQLLPCMHCFHRDCMRNWLMIQQTCPVCRVAVKGMQPCD